MIEAAKDLIRADRARGLTFEHVGRIHFISRERVRQICKEKPDEAKRAREIAAGLCLEGYSVSSSDSDEPPAAVSRIVRFAKLSLRWMEDAELQARIRAEPPYYTAIARKFGISTHAVRRIRTNAPPPDLTASARWWKSKTHEERSEFLRKGWITRRRKANVV